MPSKLETSKLGELPDDLPEAARELYQAAYDRISEREVCIGKADKAAIAQTAHEGAWFTVQTEFARDAQGDWQRAPIGAEMEQVGPATRDDPYSGDAALDEKPRRS